MDELGRVNAALDRLYGRQWQLGEEIHRDGPTEELTAIALRLGERIIELEARQDELVRVNKSDAFWARVLGEAGVR